MDAGTRWLLAILGLVLTVIIDQAQFHGAYLAALARLVRSLTG
jgi:xanthine/uracil/vitamin C permease (AzgA family)